MQRVILETVARLADVQPESVGLAVDGCSAPTFVLPLESLARAYARLAQGLDTPAGHPTTARVAQAMSGAPHLVAGTGRLGTMLMESRPGALIAKVGAEGMYAVGAIAASGPIGVALKIADGGADRARTLTVIRTLRELNVLDDAAVEALEESFPTVMRNHAGRVVGELRPASERLLVRPAGGASAPAEGQRK